MIVEEDLADHIDLNFGCPVPQGDPQGRRLGAAVEAAAVRADRAGGGDAAARPASRSRSRCARASTTTTSPISTPGGSPRTPGWRAVALHARTAAQRYSGTADWEAIATAEAGPGHSGAGQRRHLVGRRRAADDARDRLRRRVVGRGCLGRPWLFADLAAAFAGAARAWLAPALGEVARVMRRHAELLAEWLGSERDGVHRLPQACGLVPQGLPGRIRSCARRWRWRHHCPNWTICRQLDQLGAVPARDPRPAPRAHQLTRPGAPARRLAVRSGQ